MNAVRDSWAGRDPTKSNEQQVSIWSGVLDDLERLLDEQERHLTEIAGSGELMLGPEPYRARASLPPIPDQARPRAVALSLRNDAIIARARQLSDSTRLRRPTTPPRISTRLTATPTFDERA